MIKVPPEQLDLRLSFLRPTHTKIVDKMTASLIKYGQLTPVTVVADKDRMLLVDGFKRQRSARQLNMHEILVTALHKTNCEAKALIYLLNRPASFSIIAEANLIRDLIEVEGLNQVETATLLDRHKSWVSRRLAMIRGLAPEVVEDIKLALIPAGVGSSLARLPRDNQTDFSAAIQKHGLKPGEVKKLIDIWCKTKEPDVRRHLLVSPHKSLQIVKKTKENWLLLVEAILIKLSTLSRQVQGQKLSGQALQKLPGFLNQIQDHTEGLKKQIGGEHEPVK